MKVDLVKWFTLMSGQIIGIVFGKDEVTGEERAYIGVGWGRDEEQDIKNICAYGSKFPPAAKGAFK